MMNDGPGPWPAPASRMRPARRRWAAP